MFIPCSIVQKIILLLTLLDRQRQIKNLLPFLVSHVKGLFHLQDINLESKSHNWHGNHLAQWNSHTYLGLWGDPVLFKNLPHVDLCLVLHHSDCPIE